MMMKMRIKSVLSYLLCNFLFVSTIAVVGDDVSIMLNHQQQQQQPDDNSLLLTSTMGGGGDNATKAQPPKLILSSNFQRLYMTTDPQQQNDRVVDYSLRGRQRQSGVANCHRTIVQNDLPTTHRRTKADTTTTSTTAVEHNNNTTANKLIIGIPVPVGKYPFFGFPSRGGGGCGAAILIWPDVLISAARCYSTWYALGQQQQNTSTGSVYLGGVKADGSDATEVIPIQRVLPHARANDTRYYYDDILLLFLNRSSTIPIAQWNQDRNSRVFGINVTVLGYDNNNNHNTPSPNSNAPTVTLMQATVPIIDGYTCANVLLRDSQWDEFDKYHICTLPTQNYSICGNGSDAGNPLFLQQPNSNNDTNSTNNNITLLGIASFGNAQCDNNRSMTQQQQLPNVYTRLSAYTDWIYERLCQFSQNPPDTTICQMYPAVPQQCEFPTDQCVVGKFLLRGDGTTPSYRISRKILGRCITICSRFSARFLQRGWRCGGGCGN